MGSLRRPHFFGACRSASLSGSRRRFALQPIIENSNGSSVMGEAFIVDAVRTPRGIGKVGKGALADIHPQQLASTVLKAIAKRNDLNTAEVDDIIWGTSTQRGKQSMDMGR